MLLEYHSSGTLKVKIGEPNNLKVNGVYTYFDFSFVKYSHLNFDYKANQNTKVQYNLFADFCVIFIANRIN